MSTRVHTLLQEAITRHRSGRLTEAAGAYERVRNLAPANFDAWHLGGLIAFQQSRHVEASKLLRRALKLKPQSALARMRAGLVNAALGELQEAEQQLSTAVGHDPALAEGWCHLAQVLRRLGRRGEA